MKKIPPAKNVDAYLEQVPAKEKKMLEKLRQAILQAAPGAVETIRFNMPSYTLKGALVNFACFSDHCGFYVVNPGILKTFASDLEGFTLIKNGIWFSVEQPLPPGLVKKIVRQRVKENEEATFFK